MHVHGVLAAVQELLQLLVAVEGTIVALVVTLLQQVGALHDHHNVVAQRQPRVVFPHCHFYIDLVIKVLGVPKQQTNAHVGHRVLPQLVRILLGVLVSHLPQLLLSYVSVVPLIDH